MYLINHTRQSNVANLVSLDTIYAYTVAASDKVAINRKLSKLFII